MFQKTGALGGDACIALLGQRTRVSRISVLYRGSDPACAGCCGVLDGTVFQSRGTRVSRPCLVVFPTSARP